MSQAQYCDYKIEAQLNGTDWTDISSDVISSIYFSGGILGSSPLDRVGQPGEMKFDLNNTESNSAHLVGYYTPGHINCRAGFDVGLPVRLFCEYNGIQKIKWQGAICFDGIIIQPGRYSKRKVSIVAKDWMYQAQIHELYLPEFTLNKKIEEVVPLILANMARQPLHISYGSGEETFSCVFDKVKSSTTAISEFYKLAISEISFIYMTRDFTYPEILKVDGRYTRNNITSLDMIPIATSYFVDENDNIFVDENGNAFVYEDGIGTEAIYDNSMTEVEAPFGKSLYNRIKATTYPRIIESTSTTVLFSLNSELAIPAGETITFVGKYKDPTGVYDTVAGTDWKTPLVSGTDYKMWTGSGGTGSDISADLVVVPTYGSTEVAYELTNNSASTGYVNVLKATGKAIYSADEVSYIADDGDSINKVGPIQLNLDMKYLSNPLITKGVADIMLQQLKLARILLDKPVFIANRSSYLMYSFLYLEPGSRIRLLEEVTGTGNDYFINGFECTIHVGGLIVSKYYLRNAGFDTYIYGVWNSATDVWDDPVEAIWAL